MSSALKVTTIAAAVVIVVASAVRPASAQDAPGASRSIQAQPGTSTALAAVLTRAEDLDAVRERARAALTATARPRLWFACPDLPLTGPGKVDRAALREAAADGGLRRLT